MREGSITASSLDSLYFASLFDTLSDKCEDPVYFWHPSSGKIMAFPLKSNAS